MSSGAAGPVTDAPLPARGALVLLAALGGVAAALLASSPPAAKGAARLASPEVLLGAFDALWIVALAWPRGGPAGTRGVATALLLVAAAPFHVGLAASAGAGAGHGAALGSVALAAALAGLLAGRARAWPPLLSVALIALPLAGYALTDLAGVDALALVHASPLVAPVLLARDAAAVSATDGVAAAATLLVAAALAASTRRAVPAAVLLAAVAVGAAPARAAPEGVAVLPGAHVREGRPVVVRAPGAVRVRALGGPWAGPVGARGDEFVLLGARPRGEILDVEVERHGGATEVDEVFVRPLAAAEGWTAVLDGRRPGGSERAVRPVDLATVPEAWLVFDAVEGVPDGLPPAELQAIEARRRRPAESVLDPVLVPPSPDVHRALAEIAEGAPRLPRGVSRVLLVLAALIVVLALVPRQRRARTVPWIVAPAALTLAWLLLGGVLPAGVRAAALVLDDGGHRLALVRLRADRPAAVVVRAPGATGVLAPVRWGVDDAPPEGVAVGASAALRLGRGRSVVLAIPLVAPDDGPLADRNEVAPGATSVDRWLRRAGLSAGPGTEMDTLEGVRIEGAPVLRVVRRPIVRDRAGGGDRDAK